MRRAPRFLALLPVVAACSGPTRSARPPGEGEATFTVMTYNVNYGIAGDRKGIEAIRREGADVVLLQETNPAWEQAIVLELATVYPYRRFHHAGAAGGSAILSKRPLQDVRMLRLSAAVDGSWFDPMIAVVEVPGGLLQVANVHLRPQIGDAGPNVSGVISGWFSTPAVRRAEMNAILRHLDPGPPILIAGDFNESGGGALAVLESRRFEDGVEAFAPDADTWSWPTSVGRVERQLDHVVYDDRIDPLEVRVIAAGRSDHRPVLARLALR